MLDYIKSLFSVFFRWWWAIITGVCTILSFFSWPETGLSLSRGTVALSIFFGLTVLFCFISVIVVSWKWYSEGGKFPKIIQISPASPSYPLIFTVEPVPALQSGSNYLSLHRTTKYDVEVCIAILEIKTERTDGKGCQAEPIWISDAHRHEIQQNRVNISDLRLRIVRKDVIEFTLKNLEKK